MEVPEPVAQAPLLARVVDEPLDDFVMVKVLGDASEAVKVFPELIVNELTVAS